MQPRDKTGSEPVPPLGKSYLVAQITPLIRISASVSFVSQPS